MITVSTVSYFTPSLGTVTSYTVLTIYTMQSTIQSQKSSNLQRLIVGRCVLKKAKLNKTGNFGDSDDFPLYHSFDTFAMSIKIFYIMSLFSCY